MAMRDSDVSIMGGTSIRVMRHLNQNDFLTQA